MTKDPESRPIDSLPEWASVDLDGLRESLMAIGKIEDRLYELDRIAAEHTAKVTGQPVELPANDWAEPEPRVDSLSFHQAKVKQTKNALIVAKGNALEAARILGLTENGMYGRLRRYGINPKDYRR